MTEIVFLILALVLFMPPVLTLVLVVLIKLWEFSDDFGYHRLFGVCGFLGFLDVCGFLGGLDDVVVGVVVGGSVVTFARCQPWPPRRCVGCAVCCPVRKAQPGWLR